MRPLNSQPFSSHIPINRHLGDQNNNKSTFSQPTQNNNKSTFRQPYITINRHLGDQNNNKSTFTSAI